MGILDVLQSGFRWADYEDHLPDLGDDDVSDDFGDKSLNKFYFNTDGMYKIVLDANALSFAAPLISIKFDHELKMHANPVYLMWQIEPGAGIRVVDVVSDAERSWTLFKDWLVRTSGRQIASRTSFDDLLRGLKS
jgi:hypothetical protein